MESILCSKAEAGQALSLGKTKIQELCNSGAIETVTIGTRRLVLVESLKALVESAKNGSADNDA